MELLRPGPSLDAMLASAGVEVSHFFVGKRYAKLTNIPKGAMLVQHEHAFDHESVLLIGSATVATETGVERLVAPASLTMRAHAQHSVLAETDVLWACLWDNPKGETDPDKFDQGAIG